MIRPFRFLWKQLNGPQITAMMQAIFDWLREEFDALFDRLNNFSIDTATDAQLTTIGALLNIARPIFTSAVNFYWFTEGWEKSSKHGWSESINSLNGGVFSGPIAADQKSVMSAPQYRFLLKAISQSEGEPGSLKFLDDVVYALRMYDNTKPPCWYSFEWNYEKHPATQIMEGDVIINIGQTVDWNLVGVAEAVLSSIANTLYNPVPRVIYALIRPDEGVAPGPTL